jgi:ATP-dependent DNA helicase RecQ
MSIIAERITKNGIIYCSTRKNVESVHELLLRHNFKATRYHAGLSDEERKKNQDDFLYDRMTIMVATNAFGMGIDKSNVHFIVHYNMPKNIESYYQEAGRAGRDGGDAECFLLYKPIDHRTNQFLIEKSVEENPDLDEGQRAGLLEKDMQLLKEMTFYAFTDGCLRRFILKYFGDETGPCCGNCGNCTSSFEEIDATASARSIIYCVHQINSKGWPFGKTMVADVLKGSQSEKVLRNGFDRIERYASLSDIPGRQILNVIDRLVQDGYLATTGDKYPVLVLGPRARECKTSDFKYIIKTPKVIAPPPKPPPHPSLGQVNDGAANGNEPVIVELFEKLRKLRTELAAETNIPAFVVFHDSALKDMCRIRPTDEESFLTVSGVGKAKAERYGKVFMDAIRSWIEESGDSKSVV